jgi:hypothetical protein
MANLTLNSDEEIIHTTQTIIINGIRHEAVITSRRLILVESETGSIHEDIPFTEIGLATSGVNKIREPIITLNINSTGGEKRTTELIFIRFTGNQNLVELEKCIAILKEHNVPIEAKSQLTDPALLRRGERTNTGESLVEGQFTHPAIPDWTIPGTSLQGGRPLPEEAPEKLSLTIIAAVVIIIVVFVGGAFIAGQIMNLKDVPVPQNVTESDIANTIVPSASLTPTPQPQGTTGTDLIPPLVSVPTNGVWVQIDYPKNYSGYIGAPGRYIEVDNSGNRFYQLPVQNTMIDGFIEKMDGSSEKLEVMIYNGGTQIAKSETQKPLGVVEIHVIVGPAIGNSAVTNTLSRRKSVSPRMHPCLISVFPHPESGYGYSLRGISSDPSVRMGRLRMLTARVTSFTSYPWRAG